MEQIKESCLKSIYLGVVVLFYGNEHEPVHVHGKHQGMEPKAELIIKDGKVVEVLLGKVKGKQSLPATTRNDFKKFVEAYADEIVKKWIDYFVLHKEVKCETIDRKIR